VGRCESQTWEKYRGPGDKAALSTAFQRAQLGRPGRMAERVKAKVWEVWGSSLACGDPAYQRHPRTNWHARAQTGGSRLSVRLSDRQRPLTSISRVVACGCCGKWTAHALLRPQSSLCADRLWPSIRTTSVPTARGVTYIERRCNTPQFSSRSSELGHCSEPECPALTQPGHEPHDAVARLGSHLD
jgi:hypothetical protein